VVATRTPLLAPQDEQITFVVEQLDRRVESLTDLLTPHLSPAGGFIVERLLTTGLSVVFILLLATLAAQLSRRAIARMALRMKDPDAPRGRRLRARIGIDAATRVEDARRAQRADALSALATSVVTVIIWTVAVIMVLGQFAIHLGPLIAGAGIVGVAVGFGAQDLVKDFLSGVFMLVEDQYGIGDIVDVGEASGVVEGVTLRSTRIRDVHGTLWHVPNGEIRRVGNMSQEWARALLDVPIAYGADIDVAGELLRRVAVEMAHEADYRELFLDDPAMWGVEQLAADAVVLRLVIKVVPGQQWSIMRELRRRIKNAFDVAGVEVPFAQRTVWLRTEEPASNDGTGRGSYGLPVPDEATVQRAVSASRQGDTGEAVRGDLDAMLPDEPDAMLPDEPVEDPLSS
jgi:moderate conductance mechanosensitive channel